MDMQDLDPTKFSKFFHLLLGPDRKVLEEMNDLFKETYNEVISEYANQPLREDISSQEIVRKLILVARDHWSNMQNLLKKHCHSGSSIYNIVEVNSDEEDENEVDRRNDVRRSFDEVNLVQTTHNSRF
jgi:hypothetical protein